MEIEYWCQGERLCFKHAAQMAIGGAEVEPMIIDKYSGRTDIPPCTDCEDEE